MKAIFKQQRVRYGLAMFALGVGIGINGDFSLITNMLLAIMAVSGLANCQNGIVEAISPVSSPRYRA